MLLSCQSLSVGYEGKNIVSDINFGLEEGEYLCVVGENGSGKSTLMKTILGLIPALSGNILFEGGLKQTEIGYLPQQTEVQRDFPASVKEVVFSGLLNRSGMRPFYSSGEKTMALKNMDRLGISGLLNCCYRELSGGQQQRTLLARALCSAGKLLLLDEPALGLDPKASLDMYGMIYELNKKDGITIIMISHDVLAAIRYASHILHIGQTNLFFGTKDEYLETDIGKAYKSLGGGNI